MTSMIGKLRRGRTALLTSGGFASLTASAWTGIGLWAGLAAGGVSLLLLEYLTNDGEGARR